MRDSSLMSVFFLLFECFQIVFPSTAEFVSTALDAGLISIIHFWATASVKFCLGTRLHSVVLSEYMDAQPLNLNTAFYEDALSQIQAGELLLCAGASLTCLLSHNENTCFSMLGFTLKSSIFSLHYDSVVRGHKVTVLILTFSECENYLNTISLMEELQPEPETQPGTTVGAPPLRRSKRKKVVPSFLKGALLVTSSDSDLRLRPRSHDSITLQ